MGQVDFLSNPEMRAAFPPHAIGFFLFRFANMRPVPNAGVVADSPYAWNSLHGLLKHLFQIPRGQASFDPDNSFAHPNANTTIAATKMWVTGEMVFDLLPQRFVGAVARIKPLGHFGNAVVVDSTFDVWLGKHSLAPAFQVHESKGKHSANHMPTTNRFNGMKLKTRKKQTEIVLAQHGMQPSQAFFKCTRVRILCNDGRRRTFQNNRNP